MLCEPPMQSMCSLRHQCHSHGSLPHPVHHCTTCAPEARRVVSALAEGIKMPARAPDAPPVRRCSTHAPLPCLCARSAACRECPRRGDQNACSRARCRFVHPFPLSYAGSRSRSPLTHASPLELRSLLQVSRQPPLSIPGFPAEMAVIGQEYDGKPGILTGSA